MTGVWTAESQRFKLKATNTNPLIVLIKDEVGEIVKKKLVVMVKASAPASFQSALSTDFNL